MDRYRLNVLHGFELYAIESGQPISIRPVDALLLGFLALSQRPITREKVVDLIWAEQTDLSRALHSLSQSLFRIRRVSPHLIDSTQNRRLSIGSCVESDVAGLIHRDKSERASLALAERIDLLAGLPEQNRAYSAWRDAQNAKLVRIATRSLRDETIKLIGEGNYRIAVRVLCQCAIHSPPTEDLILVLLEAALLAFPSRDALAEVLHVLDGHWEFAAEWEAHLKDRWRGIPQAATNKADFANVPFLGRDDELERIELFLRASHHRTGVVFVEGETGIGKSRLLGEVVRRAAIRGTKVAACQCRATESRLPYAALSSLINAGMRPADWRSLDPEESATLTSILGNTTLQPQQSPTEPGGFAFTRSTLLRRIERVVRKWAAGQTLILAVDDAQWLDDLSAAILALCVRTTDSTIKLIFAADSTFGSGTTPIDLLKKETRKEATLYQSLGPLPVDVLQSLLQHATDETNPCRPRNLVGQSAGNPMVLLELARVTQEEPDASVSPRLRDLLKARLEGLTTSQQLVLQVIAAAGRELTAQEIAEATRQDELAVRLSVHRLRDHRLVEPGPRDTVTLSSQAFRQAVLSTVPNSFVKYLHSRLGDIAEKRAAPGVIIASHYISADRSEKIVRWATAAADECRASGAFEAVLYFVMEAAKHGRGTSEARVNSVIDSLLELGRLADAVEILRPLRHDVRPELWRYVELTRDLALGQRAVNELYRDAITLYEARREWVTSKPLMTDVASTCVELAAYAGDQNTLTKLLSLLATEGSNEPDPVAAVDELSVASRLACLAEDGPDPVALADLCRERAGELDDVPSLLRAILAQAAARWFAGLLVESQRQYRNARLTCKGRGLEYYSWRIAMEHAALDVDIGNWRRAMDGLTACIKSCSDKERAYALANLGAAAFESSDKVLLRDAANAIVDINKSLRAPWLDIIAQTYAGYSALLAGDRAEARSRSADIVEALGDAHIRIALNEPSYTFIFCARAMEEDNPDAAFAWLQAVASAPPRKSHVSQLRVDLERARLSLRLGGSPDIDQILGAAEYSGAEAIADTGRWLLSQARRGRAVSWTTLAQYHAARPT